MESQPQNPEFRINPENFHPCNLCTRESRFVYEGAPRLNLGPQYINESLPN